MVDKIFCIKYYIINNLLNFIIDILIEVLFFWLVASNDTNNNNYCYPFNKKINS